jgi:hypothetical protein
MKLKDFLKSTGYRISSGDEYLWSCYGEHALLIESGRGKFVASVVFDTKTQNVYEMTFADETKSEPYRYSNPRFVGKHKKESENRGFRFEQAWDDVDYTEVSSKEILKKARKAFS